MTTIRQYFSDPERPTFLRFGVLIDQRIGERIGERCGLGLLDLADQDYSSLHEDWDGTEAHAYEIADEILAEEGLDFGDDA